MIDHRKIQLQQVEREGRDFIEETTHEQFIINAKRKQYPEGSTYRWALGAVYGPPADKRSRA